MPGASASDHHANSGFRAWSFSVAIIWLFGLGGVTHTAIAASGDGSAVSQELFRLRSGGTLEGRRVGGEAEDGSLIVETESGLLVQLARSQIEAILSPTDFERDYLERVADLPDTAESHAEMIGQCAVQGLSWLADAHRHRLLELDPSQRSAWAALGYSDVDAQTGWALRERLLQRRGLLLQGNRVISPQQALIQESKEQAKQRQATAGRELERAIQQMLSRGRQAEAAEQLLNSYHDPAGVPKLVELLGKWQQNEEGRVLLVDLLGQIQSGSSAAQLARVAIEDTSSKVRHRALAHLADYGSQQAIMTFSERLMNVNPTKDDPQLYGRLGWALQKLQDPRVVPRLIECVWTQHTRMVGGGAGTQAGFSPEGGVAFQQGGRPQPMTRQVEQPAVLEALRLYCDGVDFGFNKQAWREWYAQRNAQVGLDLRRDP
jgi:hypothetical protein